MANFNTVVNLEPNFGLTVTNRPKKKIVKFAEGYEHRIKFGLAEHSNPRFLNLSFNDITEAQSDTLIGFLSDRANDNDSFDYTPPNDTSGKFVVEGDWVKTFNSAGLNSVKVAFREVFEP